MDVVLDRHPCGRPISYGQSPTLLDTAELLQASDYSELVAEVRQLQRRQIRMVSIRRQRARRIGVETLREVLEDADMKVCTLGYAGGFTGALNRGYQQAIDDTRRALEFAARLNARAVGVLPGARGLHIYKHVESIVRDGLEACLDDALRFRIDMLLPLNTFVGNNEDVFVPRDRHMLDWIDTLGSHRIRGMMMLRGRNPWKNLPDSWERCLRDGGMLRMAGRCRTTLGSHAVIRHILSRLDGAAVPVG